MRALIYCRQSVSDSDDTLSLESQASTLRRWAAEQGWHVAGEVRDADEKGYDDARPGLVDLLARAGRREFDVLAVWSLDRLARSVRIQENTLHELSRHGVEIRSYREPWVAQPLFRQILGAIAEEQTRTISGHVRRALSERSRRGLFHGRAPFGYQREAGVLVPDPDRKPILQALFARFVAGAGTATLADWLTAEGISTHHGRRRWAPTTVRAILRNPVYTGAVVVGSVHVEDAHPALVDAATWRRAQERLADYTWTRRKGSVSSWLEGHITHACGARMCLKARPGPDSPTPAFICSMSRHWQRHSEPCLLRPSRVSAPYAEAEAWRLILHAMRHLTPPTEVHRDLTRRAALLAPHTRNEHRRLLDQQRDAQRRRELVEDLYLSGQRDRAWFDAADGAIAAELAEVEARLAAMPVPPSLPDLTARHAWMNEMAASLDLLPEANRQAVLAELGTVVVGAGTGRQPPICIRWRPEVAPFVSVE